jgi:2-hydroxy-3-keto-5-methylthiopentenyl-1-phosphate phosphatase
MMARAALIPEFPPDGAPVSVLVDYDGTISRRDVGDELMATFFADAATLAEKDREYDEGRAGSRELMLWDISVLPTERNALVEAAAAVPHDETFVGFVDACRERAVAVEVVSDGFGFHVEPNLALLGLADLPIATNETRLDAGRREMRFPYGHPSCFVCGTCKRERVRIHQAARRAVVFVGDGTSDRFAAAHADLVFAKHRLAELCDAEAWPYRRWDTFADVTASLVEAFDDGRLPDSAADFAQWRATHAPAPRAFICGPEVWGPGRTVPGPGPR